MSEQAPQDQVQIMDPAEAYGLVHQRVYAPVFFTKLAEDYGISPQTEEEAMDLLERAGQLRVAFNEQQKTASVDQTSVVKAAGQHLDSVMKQAGYPVDDVAQRRVKQAAQEVSMDPALAHAVISLQAGAAQG